MAWLSRTERAVRDGDLHVVAQEIVADLKKALETAESTEDRIRLSKELAEWLPKAAAPAGRPAPDARPLPGPEAAEKRPGALVDWDGE